MAIQRKRTKFNGVYIVESVERKFNGRPDVSFIVDYYDNGKRVRKTVGWASEGMSAVLARDIRNELIAKSKGIRDTARNLQHLRGTSDSITLNTAFDIYYTDWLVPKRSAHKSDVGMYRKHIRNGLGKKRLDAITPHDIDILINELRASGLSLHTANYCAGIIRRTINKMIAWGKWHGKSPFTDVNLERPNNGRERYLTRDELKLLLEVLNRRSPRMYTMAILSVHCGMRFGEIAALRRSDIHFDTRTIFIADPKNRRSRHAVMSDTVVSLLHEICECEPDTLLFPSRTGGPMKSPSDAFSRAVEECGLNHGITDRRQRVVFHTLRHTYASWLALSGEGMAMIADRLGHSSLEMSRRYTHLMPEARTRTADEIEEIFRKHN